MKKFLITTVLGIATTAAFGAASLRAPQMGGTATVTTPTATNTARAGTMRTQTMKTSSVSTPSVTTTQSIATPVSTETTDARIALLKGIKGFNPGKVKDTTATTSELNSLNDRIEELTAQLDRAEAAQSTVLTEDTIDAKIEQKLTALGTSSSARETYSKAEVDNLLSALERKLPKIDDRGNINMIDPNGTWVNYRFPRYWLINVDGPSYWPVVYPSYVYTGTPSNTTWQTWENEVCQSYSDELACCINSHTDSSFQATVVLDGYQTSAPSALSIITLDDGRRVLRQWVQSCQYTDTESLRTEICGDTPIDECWVEGQNSSGFGDHCGISSCYSGAIYHLLAPGIYESNEPRYILTSVYDSHQIPVTGFGYTIYPLDVAVSNETYEEWESALCEPYSDELACCLQPYHNPNYGYDNTFNVYVPHNGYKLSMPMGPQIVTLSNGKRALKLNVQSFQYTDTASIQAAVCGTASTNDCWIEGWENYGPSVNSCGLSGYSGYAYWAM